MEKIILLAADRKPAQVCLKVLAEAEKKGFLELKAVVSEASFQQKIKKTFKKPIIFLKNNKKNEHKICQIIKDKKINLLISIQYKWIISEKIIKAVRGLAFNIHFGKLPEYRGHHLHIHTILNGEKKITTTLHWMVPEVDKGFIVFEKTSLIKGNDTSWSLMQKATSDSLRLFEKLISYLAKNKPIPKVPVKGKGHFYSINSIFELKKISSIKDFDEIDKKARAFYYPPHEPAYFVLKGKKFYVLPEPRYGLF